MESSRRDATRSTNQCRKRNKREIRENRGAEKAESRIENGWKKRREKGVVDARNKDPDLRY